MMVAWTMGVAVEVLGSGQNLNLFWSRANGISWCIRCEVWEKEEVKDDSKFFDEADGRIELPLNEMEKTGGRSGFRKKMTS